jgi:hypothetical protein
MFVFPLISILIERAYQKKRELSQPVIETAAKWFIFWGVGVRLLTVGLSQALNPAFTASILEISDTCFVAIRELGFTNISMGLLAVITVCVPSWRKAGGFCGGLYLGIAGFLHVGRLSEGINLKETIAMVSDLFIFVIVVIYLVYSWRAGKSAGR